MSGAERTELREDLPIFDWTWERDSPLTGATRAQAEQAALRLKERIGTYSTVDLTGDIVMTVLREAVPSGSRVIDAEDAAAIRRVLKVVAIVRDSVEEDEKGEFYFVPTAEELFDEVQKTVTVDDVARIARLGQG